MHRGPVRLDRYGLLYLATPYTRHSLGKPMAYMEASTILARLLMDEGLPCLCPITHWHDASTTHYMIGVKDEDWLAINRPMMNVCGAMVIPDFNDWKSSRGIAEEIVEFRENRKPVFLIDQITLGVIRQL
jgi:hypothetical protein